MREGPSEELQLTGKESPFLQVTTSLFRLKQFYPISQIAIFLHLLPENTDVGQREVDSMDVNFWDSKFDSAKHSVYAARLCSDNSFSLDDGGGDHDDARCWFPCPFCYMEIEVTALGIHLQEEHCFDLKNAVCPICAENLGKDVSGHFMLQHVSSLKRRKYNRSSFWTGSSFINGRANTCESAPDPLLSPFICGIPFTEHEGFQQNERSNINVPATSDVQSYAELSSHCQEDNEERRKRVAFVQELISSTIF